MKDRQSKLRIQAVALTEAAYEPYGKLLRADEAKPHKPANMGTAKRYNHLCNLENLRGDKANLNLCVFRCSPLTSAELELTLLEKHQLSSQVFIPMAEKSRYLAIVCLGKEEPDLSSLKAFIVDGPQGISYYPGVWHYPMTALGSSIDFACLVYENESESDCTVRNFDETIIVEIQPAQTA